MQVPTFSPRVIFRIISPSGVITTFLPFEFVWTWEIVQYCNFMLFPAAVVFVTICGCNDLGLRRSGIFQDIWIGPPFVRRTFLAPAAIVSNFQICLLPWKRRGVQFPNTISRPGYHFSSVSTDTLRFERRKNQLGREKWRSFPQMEREPGFYFYFVEGPASLWIWDRLVGNGIWNEGCCDGRRNILDGSTLGHFHLGSFAFFLTCELTVKRVKTIFLRLRTFLLFFLGWVLETLTKSLLKSNLSRGRSTPSENCLTPISRITRITLWQSAIKAREGKGGNLE